MKMKKFLFFAAILLLVGCSSGKDAKTLVQEKKVLTLQPEACTLDLTFPARLRGKQDIAILPQVSGTLSDVLVQEGERVQKGQKLFLIEQTSFRAALETAEAGVKMAEAKLENAQMEESARKDLYEKQIISEYEYLQGKNELLVAQANLQEAKAQEVRAKQDLSYTVITAPSNGVVGNINYRQGALVAPSMATPITIVSDNSQIYAYISIPESRYTEFVEKAGSKEKMLQQMPQCTLTLSNGSQYTEKGTVETMSGVVDPQTGALSVRVRFNNPNSILVAGGSATLHLPVSLTDKLLIPRTATFEIQNMMYAYKVVQQDTVYTAQSAIIEVLRLNEDQYIVENGLQAGEQIVLEGVKKLQNGQQIKPVSNQ